MTRMLTQVLIIGYYSPCPQEQIYEKKFKKTKIMIFLTKYQGFE